MLQYILNFTCSIANSKIDFNFLTYSFQIKNICLLFKYIFCISEKHIEESTAHTHSVENWDDWTKCSEVD